MPVLWIQNRNDLPFLRPFFLPFRLEAIAIMVEAIAIGLEAIATLYVLSSFLRSFLLFLPFHHDLAKGALPPSL